MALDEKCDGCQKAVGDFNVDIDFDEITKQAYKDAQKNKQAVKIEDETTQTMWICPRCKVHMKVDEENCFKCDTQIQYLMSTLKMSHESLFVKVKLSEYQDMLKK